jgi:hypothetical protein
MAPFRFSRRDRGNLHTVTPSPVPPEVAASAGGPSPSIEHRNLAEERPRPQPGDLEPVADDPSAPAEDHQRVGATLPLTDHRVAFSVLVLLAG